MTTKARLMAFGMAGGLADKIGQDSPASSIAAAGASAGNATAITASFTYVTTTPSSTGVILKNAGPAPETVIYNGGANTLKVYPATGEKINNGTATTGTLSVPTTKAAILIGTEQAWIGIVSA